MKAPDWFIKLYTEHSKRSDLYGKPWEETAQEFWKELHTATRNVPMWERWPFDPFSLGNPMAHPGDEEQRRRYWEMRDEHYTPAEQAEILKRWKPSDQPDKGIEESNGSPNHSRED